MVANILGNNREQEGDTAYKAYTRLRDSQKVSRLFVRRLGYGAERCGGSRCGFNEGGLDEQK